MRISPAQQDIYIRTRISSHIATLTDKDVIKHPVSLSAEDVKRRSERQAERELREATREVWE